MPYVDVNGVHTYYEEHGSGAPLLLLHGAAMVAEGWQPQIPALAPHFRVLVPERRGVGRTADIDGPWSYFDMARDTGAFMDVLGIQRAAVVGLSDGGNIALILAFTRPELLDRLAVSGANHNAAGLGTLADEWERMTAEEIIASAPSQVAAWLEIHRRVSPDHGIDLRRTFAKMKRMWLDYEIPRAKLATIAAPTLVMAGDRDMFPLAHTAEIWEAIPGARLCIAPGADHFWMQEQVELANRILLDFLLAPVA